MGAVLILGPEDLHRPIGRHRHLPGLAEALSKVVVGAAHLHRVRPAHTAVAGVRDVQLDVAIAGAVGAEDGPEDIDMAVKRAIWVLVVDCQVVPSSKDRATPVASLKCRSGSTGSSRLA